ncbi:rhamnulokinase [Pseudactinotalea sp.]|uniref:rhamnulokinase n=1 Tax=Pseudactinotalea sp. TaxID=1926260 RepID=UPI003B3AFC7F
MSEGAFVAVDLGASSGRVIRGEVREGPAIELTEVARFANGAQPDAHGTLRWDLTGLVESIVDGLKAAGDLGPVASIGIDTWAVDYGLIDDGGALLAEPVAYRDGRTEAAVPRVHERIPPEQLYAIGGMQHLPFNTVFQLDAEQQDELWQQARSLLLIPDLIAYLLTGARVAELTNASTTALVDVGTGEWSHEILQRLGVARSLLPAIVRPGSTIGTLSSEVAARTGLGEVPVVAVGSHDTASAVVGVPAQRADFAYISCGTWSLVGVELDEPIRTEASRAKNFTNELGVDGTVRYLRNVMGLWVLQESQRMWAEQGHELELEALLADAADLPERRTVIDVDHPDFLPPGDMPARIAEHAEASGQAIPATPAEVTRCILDSLAVAYRRAVRDAVELSGREVGVIHVVGGGSRNTLLMQLTADATGIEVVAGPEESTALGNVLVQARAMGALPQTAGLAELREVAARGVNLVRYRPVLDAESSRGWAEAERVARGG